MYVLEQPHDPITHRKLLAVHHNNEFPTIWVFVGGIQNAFQPKKKGLPSIVARVASIFSSVQETRE